eukprot:895164-Prorocentrum_minimum.AAC.1
MEESQKRALTERDGLATELGTAHKQCDLLKYQLAEMEAALSANERSAAAEMSVVVQTLSSKLADKQTQADKQAQVLTEQLADASRLVDRMQALHSQALAEKDDYFNSLTDELASAQQQCESVRSQLAEVESQQQVARAGAAAELGAMARQLEAAVSECEALSTKMAEQQAQADESLQVVTAEVEQSKQQAT